MQVRRFSRKERKNINIPQPHMISEYNRHMGGVDLLDNAVANYRISIRGKKWWWPLFINAIDCAITNAWKLHEIANNSCASQIDFRSELCQYLLTARTVEGHEPVPERNLALGRPQPVPRNIATDQHGHLIVRDGNRRRCRQCQSNTIYKCERCNCYLHPDCFKEFHS